jgi:protein TonB
MSLNPLKRKKEVQIHDGYQIRIQVGLIISMLLFIIVFRINIQFEDAFEYEPIEREIMEMEEIIQTEIIETPPPPPRPPVPISVPDDAILDDELFDFDAFLDTDDALTYTPPPPPEEEEEEPEIFVMVEQMPELIGGIAELQRHVRYPEIARRAGIEGRVVVQFIIDEQGNVVDPQVVRSLGGGTDEAAIEAIKQVRFTPGMQRGRPVKVRYTIPVQFRLTKAD